jgi:hypothetical protein
MGKKQLLASDSDQVFILFSKMFGLVVASTFTFQILRAGDKSESWDKAIFGTAILIAIFGFISLFIIKTRQFKFDFATSALALAGIILGVAGIEQHDPINGVVLSNRLWLGYGPYTLILLLVLATAIWRIWEWQNLAKIWKIILTVVAGISLILSSLSFWQNANSVIDPDHSEYVLNEVMAIRAGNWPFDNFIPQYQTVYTFFAAILKGKSTYATANYILILMSIIALLCLVIGVLLVRLSHPKKSLIPAMLIVIPFTSVTQFPTREGYMGSIASLLSGLPIRIFPGLLLFSFALWVLTSPRINARNLRLAYFILGVLSGWTMWSSQDFGIAAAITTFVIVSIVPLKTGIKKFAVLFTLTVGFAAGFLTFQVISKITGHTINYDYFAFFARQFGSGFGAENIRTPGPVLVILPLLIALTVSNLLVLRISQTIDSNLSARLHSNGILGLLFSSWSTLGFSYYLNRSYASGQMQILFLPISIALGALVGSILLLREIENRPSSEIFKRSSIKSKSRQTLVLTLIAALPLASVISLPNPTIEMDRISQGANTPRWPKPTITAAISDARAALEFATKNGVSIAYFGASSNYVSDATGINSAAILNSPFDLYMSQETVLVACQYLDNLKPDYLVLGDEGAALFQFENNSLCGTYTFFEIDGVRSGRAAKRI